MSERLQQLVMIEQAIHYLEIPVSELREIKKLAEKIIEATDPYFNSKDNK